MPETQTTALRERLAELIATRDRTAAVQTALDAVRDNGLPIEALYTHVLIPLLVDTGAAWLRGETKVWEEHFTSATVRTIVEGLYLDVAAQASKVEPLGTTAVLACPPEEAHDLGLRMLADRMALAGWTVHYLGADTPVDEIVAAAKALGADLVALSAATHYNRLLLREVVAALHRELPAVRVGVGGPAFANDKTWPAADLLTEADLGLGSNVCLTGEC